MNLSFTIGAPLPSEARTGWNWFSSFWYGTRLPLGQRGATQKINWTADLCSSFFYGTRQRGATYLSWAVYYLFCSSLSQRQSCPIPKRGANQLCSPFPVLLLAVPEAVLSHTKVRSISSAGLSLRRELCVGWLALRSLLTTVTFGTTTNKGGDAYGSRASVIPFFFMSEWTALTLSPAIRKNPGDALQVQLFLVILLIESFSLKKKSIQP